MARSSTDGPSMTRHALARALDMGVEGHEIRQCILHPETVYKSKRYPNTMNHTAGRVSIAIRDSHIVTVQWANQELWRNDMQMGRYKGRSYRGEDG